MRKARRIETATPVDDVWRSIRFFTEPDFCMQRILQLHPETDLKRHGSNLQKQARQASYALRQAEEYFIAAQAVGAKTKAVLLYYGIVCLSQALILIGGTGLHSFDARRKQKSHNHHGLVLDESFDSEQGFHRADLQRFLGVLGCKCHVNARGELWGQFPLFAEFMSPGGFAFSFSRMIGDSGMMGNSAYYLDSSLPDLEEIGTEKLSLLDIVGELPDMYDVMAQLGLPSRLCRVSIMAEQYVQSEAQLNFFFYELDENTMSRVVRELRCSGVDVSQLGAADESILHLAISTPIAEHDANGIPGLPCFSQSLTGKVFALVNDGEPGLGELRGMFAAMFTLGMLSRYHPDVWVGALEGNAIILEFVDSLLQITSTKVPQLMLDQLTGAKHCVNHRY